MKLRSLPAFLWVVLFTLAGCRPAEAPAAEQPPQHEPQATDWVMIPPAAIRQTGILAHPRLAEASGAAVTDARPGSFWTLGDSGNPPELYLADTTGALLLTLPLAGVENIDWEEVALGPCPAGRCLYIADTGDNLERRDVVAIHRLREPPLAGKLPGRLSPQPVESIQFRYSDGPHDVEAMAVTPAGDVLLVSKGRRGSVTLFRLPASSWGRNDVIAEPIAPLPIPAVIGMGRVVTGMAVSRDGRQLMIRTYRDLYPFELSRDGSFLPRGKPTACDILGREPQGEGVDWLNDRDLLLTSERGLMKEGTVMVVRCSV